MTHSSSYEPSTGIEKWLDQRLPVPRLMYDQFLAFPTPRNLNYWWTVGGILTFMLVSQIATGVVLAMNYVATPSMAFDSVEHIMRDVNWGWLLRYTHAVGASMFFLAAYIHTFNGLHGLLAGMGADELLGGDRDHQSLFLARRGDPRPRHPARAVDLGRLRRRRPNADAALQPALFLSVRDRRHCSAAHLGAAHSRQQQSDRDRRQERARHGAVPSLLHDQGRLRARAVRAVFRNLRVLRAEPAWPSRQLHSGEPAADAAAHRAGMVFSAVLRDSPRNPEQAVRRRCADMRNHRPVIRAVARYLARALDELPADLQMVLLGVRGHMGHARLSRLPAAGRHLSRAGAHFHCLLFPVFSRGDASGGMDRETESSAWQHHRIRARAGGGAAGHAATCAAPPYAGAGAMTTLPLHGIAGAAGLAVALAVPLGPALAADEAPPAVEAANHEPSIDAQSWSFTGPFGVYDNAQLQRGFLVYKTICANCHSMRLLSYRNLGG